MSHLLAHSMERLCLENQVRTECISCKVPSLVDVMLWYTAENNFSKKCVDLCHLSVCLRGKIAALTLRLVDSICRGGGER